MTGRARGRARGTGRGAPGEKAPAATAGRGRGRAGVPGRVPGHGTPGEAAAAGRGRGRAGVPGRVPGHGTPGEAAAAGRGRGRGPPAAGVAPRPGSKPPAPTQPKPPSGDGFGRGTGEARDEPQPGGATEAMTRQLQATTIGGKEEGRGRRIDDVSLRTRPEHLESKQGTSGEQLALTGNFFRLEQAPDCQLYQYNVGFTPEVESRKMRSWLVKSLAATLGSTRAFDGMVLFLPKRLPSDETKLQAVTRNGAEICVTITLTNELPADSPVSVQLYNVILRRMLSMIKMERIGRHYFSPSEKIEVAAHKMELWPGLSTSIMQYESSIMLCAEIQHKVLHSESLLSMMYELYNSTSKEKFYDVFTEKYVGQIVLTSYNNKTYYIDGVDWDSHPPDFSFKLRDGREINLVEYYKEKYKVTITDMKQPLLISMPKERDRKRGQTDSLRLVPELCRITGLSDEIRSDFSVMKDLATHTRIGPAPYYAELRKINDTLNTNPSVVQELAGWCIKLQSDLVSIKARKIGLEKIYQRDSTFCMAPEGDWSRDMRGNRLCSTVTLQHWILMFTGRDENVAQDFLSTLTRVSGPMGINVAKPRMCKLKDDTAHTYVQALQQEIRPDTQLVVCVVPNNRKDRYDAIKKLCSIMSPVVSQVVVSRTLSKKQMLMSVCTKIGIQINCKLGGEAWALEIPIDNIMVIGIDCYPDSSTKGKSAVGFVASTNKTLTKFYSRCTVQTQHQEMIDGLKVCMVGALKHYNEVNGVLPDKIFIYRDGVRDGQLSAIVDYEVPSLLSSFKDMGDVYQPKVAYIVVKRHINPRFFANDGDSFSNPPPGTVVDSEVTNPAWYDFFLVSRSVRQGTVTPTSYNIVYDTVELSAEHMQRLTYKLTHLYFNWPGIISVPAPCQYAHKLAFLVGQSLHAEPASELWDKLFYL